MRALTSHGRRHLSRLRLLARRIEARRVSLLAAVDAGNTRVADLHEQLLGIIQWDVAACVLQRAQWFAAS